MKVMDNNTAPTGQNPATPMPLEKAFLKSMSDNKVAVTVFLVNGIKLQGFITSFDACSVILMKDNIKQMLYKHAISSVMPMVPHSFSLDQASVDYTASE